MPEFKISNKTIVQILSITTVFIGLILLGLRVSQQIIWLLVAGFLALALEPAVDRLSRYMPWKNRGLALTIVFSIFIGLFTFLAVTLTPPLISQGTQFAKELPNYANNYLQSNDAITIYIKQHMDISSYIGSQQQLLSKATSASNLLFSSAMSILSSILAIFTIFIFTFFLILEIPNMVKTFWRYQPEKKIQRRKRLLTEMYQTVSGFVNGTLIRTLLAGIVTLVLLLILRVPYALSLGVLVALFGIIPMVGGIIGIILVTLITLLFSGFSKALIVFAFYMIYSLFENYVLQPIIFKKSVNISPFVTGVAAVMGVVAAGFIGALVAIPVAASLQILFKDYLETNKEK